MNYLFQIRGFSDIPEGALGHIDYSGQTMPNVDETVLNETTGLGSPLFTNPPATAAHCTRWYAPPNALDIQQQNTTGGRFAAIHCDGTPIGPNEPTAVRVNGSTFSAPLDWNNDLVVPAAVSGPQDVNFNGSTSDAQFQGFNDWINIDLRQISARTNTFGLSTGAGTTSVSGFGGGTTSVSGFGGGVSDLSQFGGGTTSVSGFGGGTTSVSGFGGGTTSVSGF